ncbi:MAG: carboxypeptidase-like regulatory domain-containing protein, partial [Saprospiraceae bacterium]
MSIAVAQPQEVIPGKSVQVKVNVRDAHNKKVQGVNLVAGAINAQFNSAGSFSPVQIESKRVKPLKKYENFELDRQGSYKQNHPLTKEWYEKFKLQDQLYYRLRFAEKSIYQHYDTLTRDSFYKNIAQFAPYVVNNGQSQPVVMIYCNRKLVYYYETDNNTPYSFVGNDGYNLITIRTPAYEYWIDSVKLNKGQKLEFSIDENAFQPNKSVSRKPMPDSLITTERKLLKDKIISLRGPLQKGVYYYIWQDLVAIHRFNLENGIYNGRGYKFPILVGPFDSFRKINYVEQNGFGINFIFEPGFSYNITPRREYLYEFSYFDKAMLLPKKLPYKTPGQRINKASDIQYFKQEKTINVDLQSTFKRDIQNGGSYQFFYKNMNWNNPRAIAIVNDSTAAIEFFQPNVNIFKSLPIGHYTMTLVNYSDELYQKQFEIKSGTLLYHNLDTIHWNKDSTGLILKLFHKVPSTNQYNKMNLQERFDIPNFILGNNFIQGRILDKSGEPLIGANILIKGTSIGTTTDVDGYYTIVIPNELKNPTIIINYVGYSSQEVQINNNDKNSTALNLVMEEDMQALEEVVVVGLGVQMKRSITASVTSITNDAIQGRAAGVNVENMIRIKGMSTLPSAAPLYVVDGIVVNDISKIAEHDIADVKFLKGAEATALYGARAADGVMVITTKSKGKLDLFTPELLESSGIRSNFRDYAYWQPNLITDQNGEAYFTVTYPDNITSWNTFVLGMDRKRRAGVAYGNTKSYKPLLAQLAMPRFLVEGDEVDIIGKSINYTNDTLHVKTSFKIGAQLLQEQEVDVIDGITEKAKVVAPAQQDSIQATYALAMGEYVDGEQRSIP